MSNEEKKKVLKSYGNMYIKLQSLKDQLYELEQRHESPMIQRISDMPNGSRTITDLSDVIAQKSELELNIKRTIEQINNKRINIERAIKNMEDGKEASILWLRYIKLLSWKEIEDTKHYSKRTVLRIHENALRNIFV